MLVSMKGVDPLGLDCIARYEDALIKAEASGTKIRALILCNPHNPLGKCKWQFYICFWTLTDYRQAMYVNHLSLLDFYGLTV